MEDREYGYSEYFPFWERLNPQQKEAVSRNAVESTFTKGELIHNATEECVGVILIHTGQLRIYIQSEDGRDVTLYRLYPGEACVLSASCFMREITFDILMDAEEESQVTVIPTAVFRKLSEENIYVENYIYKQTTERFSDVMWTMQQILFMSFDRRLAVFLSDETAKTGSDTLVLTHDQIAKYTGSAREVVSRMLKYFENEGLVKLSRGKVLILDKKRLQDLARQSL